MINLDPIEAGVGDTQVAVDLIKAAYDFHKKYYSRYSFGEVAADFATDVSIDSYKVTLDGASTSVSVSCSFGYSGDKETTSLALPLDTAGAWKVTVETHFAGVGYTFVIPINVQ